MNIKIHQVLWYTTVSILVDQFSALETIKNEEVLKKKGKQIWTGFASPAIYCHKIQIRWI